MNAIRPVDEDSQIEREQRPGVMQGEQISTATWETFLCASRLKISICFSSFLDFWSLSTDAVAQFSPSRPADHVRSFDLMSSVWRIKSEAFGVASITWKSGFAGFIPFHAVFWKPYNCLDHLPLLYVTSWFKAYVELKITLFLSLFAIFIWIVLYTFFLDCQGVILLTQLRWSFLVWLCHMPPAAFAQWCDPLTLTRCYLKH